MTLPALRSFMPGRKVLIVRNVAVRLPSRDARHSSSLVSSSGPGFSEATACIGDEDIYRPEFLLNLAAHGLNVTELGHVGHEMHGPSAGVLDFPPHGGQRRPIPAVDYDLGALPREQPGNGRADTARTARHQSRFIFQQIHAHPPFSNRYAAAMHRRGLRQA